MKAYVPRMLKAGESVWVDVEEARVFGDSIPRVDFDLPAESIPVFPGFCRTQVALNFEDRDEMRRFGEALLKVAGPPAPPLPPATKITVV